MRAHSPDYILFSITAALLLLGLVTLFSASSVRGATNFEDPAYYLKHQLLYGVLPGILAGLVAWRIPYRFWRRLSFLVLIATLGLLVMVFTPQFGVSLKGASRWVRLGGIVIQPSEFFKLGLVIFLANFFGSRQGRFKSFGRVMLPFLIILGIAGSLLVAQPSTGTLGVIVFTALGMYFLAGARLANLIIIGALGIIIFAALVISAPYRIERFITFLNPSHDPQGAGYQVLQAMIGIGSGGPFGVGIGHSRQKFLFLPETIGDSIFAIFAEETGFVGSVILATLFFFLVQRGLRIAKLSRDGFGRLLAGGIAIWMGSQAFVNIAAISGLIPLTGIPLPFFSYGGSAMMVTLAGMGMLLNISKYTS